MRYWLRILAVNLAASIAVVGISGFFSPGVSWAARGRAMGISLTYANCIGTLLAVTIPLVAPRCRFKHAAVTWTAMVATMAAGTIVGSFAATSILVALGVVHRRLFSAWFGGALSTSLFISLIIGIAVTLYETLHGRLAETTLALRTKERDEADARRLATEAQLTALESRVQPHFLFNTLNSIAALTHDDPVGAERMTTQLASLLRSSLDSHSSPTVPLGDELEVVRNYLDIEGVRFGDRLRYTIDADEASRAARVPRLSVQTLVENSVKYAVSPRREGGTIDVRAVATDGQLRVEVSDDGPGFDPAAVPEGHGLALLRARLQMLFHDRASLDITRDASTTRVVMKVSN